MEEAAELGGVQGEGTVVWMYCMREEYIFKNNNKTSVSKKTDGLSEMNE